VRLVTKGGALQQRYTGWTLLLWCLSLAASAGVHLLTGTVGMDGLDLPMTLTTGVGMLDETLTLGVRALSTGLPFSTDERSDRPSKGRPNHAWADRLVAAAHAFRPVTPPPGGHLHRSPTLRDGLAWLRGAPTSEQR
jgi:hypothetical protein